MWTARSSRGFGEALAILTALGLLDRAVGVVARSYEARTAIVITERPVCCGGTAGLIGGQAIDLLATDQQITFEMLERIHCGKTGALFS